MNQTLDHRRARPGAALELSPRVRRVVGWVLVILGLVLNRWTLEAVVVPDGEIVSAAPRRLILLMQLALVASGLAVWFVKATTLLRVGLSLVSLGLTVLALEAAFRVLGVRGEYPAPRTDRFVSDSDELAERMPYALVPNSTVRSTYSSNPRGYFDPGNTIDHVHNSQGWRDVEHPLEKPDGTYRILGVGDSYLFGQGVRYEDIVLTRLGRLLEEESPGLAVETINTGHSGSNTVDQRDMLRDRGLEYEPDLIVLFFVLNDVEQHPLGREEPKIAFFRNYTAIYQKPDWLSRYSNLWSWASQRVRTRWVSRRYIESSIEAFSQDSADWELSRDALDDIHRMASERDIPLLVVIFPFFHQLDGDYPFQLVHDVVREHCEQQNIPVLDLRESYRDFAGPELWVHETDQHPNEIAHGIAAQSVLEFLRDNAHLWPGLWASAEGPGEGPRESLKESREE